MLNRDEETGEIEFRHYTIKVVPVGLSKGIKKIAVGKVPNLARFEDMTEFLASKGNMTSDSEGEDDESSKVTLPQGVSARGSLPQVPILSHDFITAISEIFLGFQNRGLIVIDCQFLLLSSFLNSQRPNAHPATPLLSTSLYSGKVKS